MPHQDPDTTGEPTADARADEPSPPGPADHGRHGGMATREKAPELTGGDDAE